MVDRERYGFGDYDVTEISHYTIELKDGTKLSARLWIPDLRQQNKDFSDQFAAFNNTKFAKTMLADDIQKVLAPHEKFPAILEYIPYYKDVFTATRDYNRHPWFASHGFVSVRVEMRGTGASEGFYYGEYLPQEQTDCTEVINFIASQAWSNGKIGMYGKSWGGFNGLQMGFVEPEDSPLKTVISLYSTDNRYTGDMHYEGGCVIGSGLLSWAGEMFARNAMPPPPRYFTEKQKWLDTWKERLDKTGQSPMSSWLHHQTPGSFWEHGSIDVDYAKVTIPVLAIGGLEDGYKTAALRMAGHLNGESKVIIGPWCHNWPDVSTAGPVIDYLTLCLSWFSFHLKGKHVDLSNKCTAWPRLQLFVRDSFKPDALCTRTDIGRFIKFDDWMARSLKLEEVFQQRARETQVLSNSELVNVLYLSCFNTTNKILLRRPEAKSHAALKIYSHSLQGANSGTWCPFGSVSGYAGDQATSIANTVSFYSESLAEPLVMIGSSQFILKISASSWSRVYISVKISDVDVDDVGTLVTRAQYDLNYLAPIETLQNTRTYVLPMNLVSHCFQPGHTVVISISPNAFPMMWPADKPADLHIYPDFCRYLYQTESLEYLETNTVTFPLPRPLFQMPKEQLSRGKSSSLVTKIGDKVKYIYSDDSGMEHLQHTVNVLFQEKSCETYETDEHVNYGLATIDKEFTAIFDDLSFSDSDDKEIGVKMQTHQVMRGDGDCYRVEETLKITWEETNEEIFNRTWDYVAPRQDHDKWK